MKRLFVLAVCTGIASIAHGALLSEYTNVATATRIGMSEASGIAYNPVTDHLYAVDDQGRGILELDKNGVGVNGTALSGFNDSEGIAYFGADNQGRPLFLVADERIQRASLITFTGASSPTAESHANFAPAYTFGPSVGNIGLEGISYDHLTNTVWGVKEANPQAVYRMDMTQGSGNPVTNPFDPAVFDLFDTADIYMMSNSAAFAGTDREWNLLILSQESQMLLELTRTGEVVGSLDLSTLGLPRSTSIEGVVMDNVGNLFFVAEGEAKGIDSFFYAVTPVPEPSTLALGSLAVIGGGIALLRRRVAARR